MAAPWSGGAELRMIGEIHGSQTVNVLHFATNTVINDAQSQIDLLLALAQAMLACVLDQLMPAVTSDWQLKSIDAKLISPQLSDPVEVIPPSSESHGQLSASSTSFISSLILKKTGGGGKSGRGKIFLPPAGEAEIANSAIDGPTLLLLAAFVACVAGKFIGAGATENWRIGVLSHKKLTAAGGTFDNSFRECTQLVASDNPAIMGSRRKGVGS